MARLVKIIGEQLIGDNSTGLMELIKNGFDADATQVIVKLNDLFSPEQTEIVIEDNGNGMNEATICGPWSEPAHGNKEEDKKIQKTTPKGRSPLGEKGVGRFAAQRLGHRLEMVTRSEGEKLEYRVDINWDKFDSNTVYIDDILIPLERRDPVYFTGEKHGTKLTIRHARTAWTRKDVAKLQARLMRLLSPVASNQDFNVLLKVPELPEFENLSYDDVLTRFQFKIDSIIDDNGMAKFTYSYRKSDGTITQTNEQENLWMNVTDDENRLKPSCGPFRVVVCAWLRTLSNLKDYDISREQLNDLCGVSIYRDGFRVIPYGDINNDWLGLSMRRVKVPGEKYDNDQVIGRVEISNMENGSLVDKTSREGLQENKSFSDLRLLVLGVVHLLENESLSEREKFKKPIHNKRQLQQQVEDLKKKVEEITETSPVKETETGEDYDTNKLSANVEVPLVKIRGLEKQSEKIQKTAQDIPETNSPFLALGFTEDDEETLLHLASNGLIAERFSHEFYRMVGTLSSNLARLEESLAHNVNVKALRLVFDVLQNEIKLLNTAGYMRKMNDVPMTNVKEVINVVIDANRKQIDENSIIVSIDGNDTLELPISKASLCQVLDNIVSNSVYWLKRRTEENERKLFITINADDRSIELINTGPKIQQNVKKSLLQKPFISSKPDGRGLGMYLSAQILKKHNALLGLIDDPAALSEKGNIGFRIVFSGPDN